MAKAIIFVLLVIISPAAYAVDHTVGGSSGWTNNGVNYDNWARGTTFAIGDNLIFNYGGNHAVDEVSASDYQSCNTGSPISSDSNSPTTISLTAVGPRFFLCPRSNHCNQGQKLTINVVAAATPSPPSSGPTPSPPSNGTTSSPPSSGTTPSPPSTSPPPPGGAATSLGGRNSFIVGFLVVLAAVIMG